MIKEQNQPNVPTQVWTFNDAGNTFIIKKNNNLFNFKLCNTLTNQWHQSEDVELQRINEQTIKAAFDPKVESVSYELSQKSQKSINLQFRVKIEYLSSNFCEQIELSAIEMNQKQQIKMQLEKVLRQALRIQELVQKQIMDKRKKYYLQCTSFYTSSGKMFGLILKRGRYIFSATGAFTSAKLYNGECYDNGYDLIDYNTYAFQLRLRVSIGENSQLQFFSTLPKFYDSHEYPYIISGIFDVYQQESPVNFTYDAFKINDTIIMNTNLLTVVPISHLDEFN